MSTKKGGSKKGSWVWNYFEEAEAKVGRKGRCLVEINDNACGHVVLLYIPILVQVICSIIKDVVKQPWILILKLIKCIIYTKMKKLNVLLPNLFDSQLFYILKSQSFIELINVLDPYYQLPSDKKLKLKFMNLIIIVVNF